MTSEISEAAIAFEAVKTSLSQTKDGVILRLAIHPNDLPTALIQDWVGTRYMVGMARVNDEGEIEPGDFLRRANTAIRSAGMLCRNERFWRYLSHLSGAPVPDETAAQNTLRDQIGVTSRTEFRTDKDALEAYESLRADFERWHDTREGRG